ncbi:WD40 repeat-like protein [Basidiobolus ranarum]|uniref:WD40 repeat-like protein n=1 Tax=Basidiobolus ranarum TaxID=34480 RepID=A0ABR2W485_9FUNG
MRGPKDSYGAYSRSKLVLLVGNGYYIAYGDIQGNIRIWNATQEEYILTSEYKIINRRINAVA